MILRRHAIAMLFATVARSQDRLAAYFDGTSGVAILISVPKRQPVATHGSNSAGRLLVPPGSTIKPFAIAALLETGKLRPADTFRCPGDLHIAGRNLACTHPRDLPPMQARTAIAYSCNCFVAHFAERFEPGELTRTLARYGMASRTEWVAEEATGELRPADPRLQALGEEGVLVTPAGLLMAYHRLAVTSARVSLAPVLGGLEDAVEFGTAQRARLEGVRVAGKTGSAHTADGVPVAWFAGFVPSVAPKFAIAVMLQGRSGGADAAPVAGRILGAAWRGQL